jgi:hypothetical protein
VRTIRTYGDGPSVAVHDAVGGVFAAELLAPSRAVWVVSPWISNIDVLDNSQGAYGGIAGDLPRRHLRLADVLEILARDPRCDLTVVTRDEPTNRQTIARLREVVHRVDNGKARVLIDAAVHEKALLTDRVLVSGSMNFTLSGTSNNSEAVTVDRDAGTVQEAHVQLTDLHRRRHEDG